MSNSRLLKHLEDPASCISGHTMCEITVAVLNRVYDTQVKPLQLWHHHPTGELFQVYQQFAQAKDILSKVPDFLHKEEEDRLIALIQKKESSNAYFPCCRSHPY